PFNPKNTELAFIRENHASPIGGPPLRILFGEAESRSTVSLLEERLPPLDPSHQTAALEEVAHNPGGDGGFPLLPEDLLRVGRSATLTRGHQLSNPTLAAFRDSPRATHSACILVALGLLPMLADVCHGRRADSLAASNLAGWVLFLQEDEDAGAFLGSERR